MDASFPRAHCSPSSCIGGRPQRMKFDPGQNVNKVLMTMYVHALGEASPNVRQRASVQGAWPHFWDTSENEMVYIYINIYRYIP